MTEDADKQLTDKLNVRAERVTRKTLTDSLETMNTNLKKFFYLGAFTCVARETMTAKLKNDDVCIALQSAIIRVATSGTMVQTEARMVVKKETLMIPLTKFVAEQAKKK